MKTKYISKILGWGLSTGIVFSLGVGALIAPPAMAQVEMEWSEIVTPSWEDCVIEPGSDIYDYAVASDDGDIVYAVGAINTVVVPRGSVDGLTGSFDVLGGEVSEDARLHVAAVVYVKVKPATSNAAAAQRAVVPEVDREYRFGAPVVSHHHS